MAKKRGKKEFRRFSIKIHLTNRWLYTFIALGILAIIGVGVYALAPGSSGNPGHNIQDVGPPTTCANGQFLQFIDSTNGWGCTNLVSEKTRYYTPSLVGYTPLPSYVIFYGYEVIIEGGGMFRGYIPVNLPDEAIVTEFRVWSAGGGTGGINLYRADLDDGDTNLIMGNIAMATGGTDNTIDYATIDNTLYTYYVLFGNTNNVPGNIYGIRIKYTITD